MVGIDHEALPLRQALLSKVDIARPSDECMLFLASRAFEGEEALKLQPRLYSIASSPKAHPGEVHLTVSAVRWNNNERTRTGIGSCYLAFSRDQAEKIYVQTRMRENAAELWAWFEQGAHFYVCGDAKRMARDVEMALMDIAMGPGATSATEAKAWLDGLAKAGCYQRDVY
jgi:sulfite reductase alpha subunit-like flavoprotein